MTQIRNTATRDLHTAGRIFPAGETVEVGPNDAKYLSTNPNFETVAETPEGTEKPRRGGKKD